MGSGSDLGSWGRGGGPWPTGPGVRGSGLWAKVGAKPIVTTHARGACGMQSERTTQQWRRAPGFSWILRRPSSSSFLATSALIRGPRGPRAGHPRPRGPIGSRACAGAAAARRTISSVSVSGDGAAARGCEPRPRPPGVKDCPPISELMDPRGAIDPLDEHSFVLQRAERESRARQRCMPACLRERERERERNPCTSEVHARAPTRATGRAAGSSSCAGQSGQHKP